MAEKPRKRKRDRKPPNIVVDWLAYAALRLALLIMYRFSVDTNLRFGKYLGSLMWKHYDRGRRRALDNLRASYPEKDEQWLIETGQRSFQQIGMLVIDILFTPRLVNRKNWCDYSKYKNLEHAKWLMQGERGLLMVAFHYGNFEIMGYLMGVFGFDVYSIARPIDNRFINKYLYGIRERAGQKMLDKKGAAAKLDDLIAGGSTLCFVADQDAGKKGIFVDFFGRRASTYKSIALVAMQHNLPIGVVGCRRVGDRFFFEIEVIRLIMPQEWADKDDPMRWITQEYVKATEDFIRQDPTQYWWLHRRWKTLPKRERKAKK